MASYNYILKFSILLIAAHYCQGITMEQVRTTAKSFRDVCQPKFKITNDIADNIKNGIFPEDKNVKCYINCMLEMTQAMKNGKLNYDISMRQIDLLLPETLKQPMKNGLNACKNSADGILDPCEASYAILKCFYRNIPEFEFP